jgi:hypothetical protein
MDGRTSLAERRHACLVLLLTLRLAASQQVAMASYYFAHWSQAALLSLFLKGQAVDHPVTCEDVHDDVMCAVEVVGKLGDLHQPIIPLLS